MAGEIKEVTFSEGIDTNPPAVGNLFITTYITKTTDYTAQMSDSVIGVDGTSNPVTIALPTAVGSNGKIFIIKALNITNLVQINPNGTETIDGNSSNYVFVTQYEFVMLISNGSNWLIIG